MLKRFIKTARKIDSRYPGMVTLESPVFPEDEARNREFAEAEPLPFEPGMDDGAVVPLSATADSPSEQHGAAAFDDPRLAYDIEALPGDFNGGVSGQKLRYDIRALPGRQRYHISRDGNEVVPTTGAQALGYYGVSKKGNDTNIEGLSSRMIPTIGEMAAAAEDLRLPKPVITAGSDGRHLKNSLHYKKRGLDYRGNNITDSQGEALRSLVDTRLGEGYDVLFEQRKNKPQNDHFHIEFDPPRGRR